MMRVSGINITKLFGDYSLSQLQRDAVELSKKVGDVGMRSLTLLGAAFVASRCIKIAAEILSPVVFYGGVTLAVLHHFVPALRQPAESIFDGLNTLLNDLVGDPVNLIPEHWRDGVSDCGSQQPDRL